MQRPSTPLIPTLRPAPPADTAGAGTGVDAACGLVSGCPHGATDHVVRRLWPGFVMVVGVCDHHRDIAARLGYAPTDEAFVTLFCTWEAACPEPGTQRVERDGETGGSVEFVCARHLRDAYAAGYVSPADLGPTP